MEDLSSIKTQDLENKFSSLKTKLIEGEGLNLNFDTQTFKNSPIAIKLVQKQISQETGNFSEKQLNSLWSEGKFEVDSGIQGYPFIWEENSVKLVSNKKMTDTFRKDLSASIEQMCSILTLFNHKNTTGSLIYGIKATFKGVLFYFDILLGCPATEKPVSLEHIAFERHMEIRFESLHSMGIASLFEKENINELVEIFKKLEKHLQKANLEQEITLKYPNRAKITEEMIKYSISFLNSEIDKLENIQLKAGFKQFIRLTQEYFTDQQQAEDSISALYKQLLKEINENYPILTESAGGKAKFIKKKIDEKKLKLLESLKNPDLSRKMIYDQLNFKWFHDKWINEAKYNNSAVVKHFYYNKALDTFILRGNGRLEYFEKMRERMFTGWRLYFHAITVWEETKVNLKIFWYDSFMGINGFKSLFYPYTTCSVLDEEQEKILEVKEDNTFYNSYKNSSLALKAPKYLLFTGIVSTRLVWNLGKFALNTCFSVSTETLRYFKEIFYYDSYKTIPKRCGYFPMLVNTVYLLRNGLANIALFPVILGYKFSASLVQTCFSVIKYSLFFILKVITFKLLKNTSKLPKSQSDMFKLISGPGIDSNVGKETSLKEALVLVKANLLRLQLKHQKINNDKKIRESHSEIDRIGKESENQGLNLKLSREEEKEIANLLSTNQKFYSDRTKSLPQTINVRFTKTELIALFSAVEELLEATKPEFVLKEFNSPYFKLAVPSLVKDSLGSLSVLPVENKHKLTEMRLKGNIDEHIEELKSKVPSLTAILEGKEIKSNYWEEYFTTSPLIQNWINKDNLFSTDNPFYIPSTGPFNTHRISDSPCWFI